MPYAYICICDACATAKNAGKRDSERAFSPAYFTSKAQPRAIQSYTRVDINWVVLVLTEKCLQLHLLSGIHGQNPPSPVTKMSRHSHYVISPILMTVGEMQNCIQPRHLGTRDRTEQFHHQTCQGPNPGLEHHCQ